MTQLAKSEAHDLAPANEGQSLINVIAAASANPDVDVDKLERLIQLQERVMNREAEHAFNAAMNLAQLDLGPVAADANNPQTKSRYASYLALDRAIRPIYGRHGLSLSFDTGDGAPADCIRVVCYVAHRDGHSRTYHVDMPADGKGAKGGDVMTKTHATGAAMSYGQRYLLKLIFNIAVGDDKDGNTDRGGGAAVEAAIAAINECQALDDLKAWKVKNAVGLKALPGPQADAIIRAFNDRYTRMKETGQ